MHQASIGWSDLVDASSVPGGRLSEGESPGTNKNGFPEGPEVRAPSEKGLPVNRFKSPAEIWGARPSQI